MRMKCLYIGFMFFAYNYVTWSQEISSPTNEETSHVCDGNSTTVTDHIPISIPDSCPKDMLLYSGHSAEEPWGCAIVDSCISRWTIPAMNVYSIAACKKLEMNIS